MKLLGVSDLAKRWNYTKQGVHQRMKRDSEFPQAIAMINKNILVFREEDIIPYERTRKELRDPDYKRWYTHSRWIFGNG